MADEAPAPIAVHPLARTVALLTWNGASAPDTRRLQVTIEGAVARPAFTQMRLSGGDGAQRNFLALRHSRPDGIAAVEISGNSGPLQARFTRADCCFPTPHEFDPHLLLGQLAAGEQAKLLRFILEVCVPVFRVAADGVLVANARALLNEVATGTGTVVGRCALLAEQLYCEGMMPERLGENLSAVLLTAASVQTLPVRPQPLATSPRRAGHTGLGLVLPPSAAAPDARILIFGENGLICRKLASSRQRLPGAHAWLGRTGAQREPHRRFILDCLARGRLGRAASTVLLRELNALVPLPGQASGRQIAAPRAKADLIIDADGGLFVCGTLVDAHGLVDGFCIEQGGVERAITCDALARFRPEAGPEAGPEADKGGGGGRDGFAVFLDRRDGSAAGAPVRLSLRLHSGARIPFATGPVVLPAAAACELILAALPDHGPHAEVPGAVGQAIAALLREQCAAARGFSVLDLGPVPAHPAASVVMPFDPDPSLLRCRMGLFALDRALAGTELVHVAERPEHAGTAERLIGDLHAAYGLAGRLIVSAHPAPAGVVLNQLADVVRGRFVCFLGARTMPESPGWLGRLIRAAMARPQAGIVGAASLFPDHSLLSAGRVIGTDSDDRWSLRALLAGFPRDYAPAAAPSRVAAVEPDGLLLRSSLLRELGGFAEDCLLAETAWSDLCLKARARGLEVWRLPDPAVFRLGRETVADATSRLATMRELDRRTLERRWRPVFDAERVPSLLPAPQPAPADLDPPAPAAVQKAA